MEGSIGAIEGPERDDALATEGRAVPEPPLPPPVTQPSVPARPRLNFRLGTVPGWLYVWIPIVTSLASLGIAIWSVVLTTSEPEVRLIMPEWVRIAQGGTNSTQVLLQPTFVSLGSNRVDVIMSMKLQVTALDGGETREFDWHDRAQLGPNVPQANGPQFQYMSDPSPLLISPENPQVPICRFITDSNWKFKPGAYRLTVVAQRAVGQLPLEMSVQVTFTPEMIKYYEENKGLNYLPLRAGK